MPGLDVESRLIVAVIGRQSELAKFHQLGAWFKGRWHRPHASPKRKQPNAKTDELGNQEGRRGQAFGGVPGFLIVRVLALSEFRSRITKVLKWTFAENLLEVRETIASDDRPAHVNVPLPSIRSFLTRILLCADHPIKRVARRSVS
jgi:hypothetical protein